MRRAIISISFFLFVAACATIGGGRPTAVTNDLRGACITASSAWDSYDDVCSIKRNCPTAQRKDAAGLKSKAGQYCATGDERHRPAVLGIADQLKKLGR